MPDEGHFWMRFTRRGRTKNLGSQRPVDTSMPSPIRKKSVEPLLSNDRSSIEGTQVRYRCINNEPSLNLNNPPVLPSCEFRGYGRGSSSFRLTCHRRSLGGSPKGRIAQLLVTELPRAFQHPSWGGS